MSTADLLSTSHLLLKVSLLILFRTLWPLRLSPEFFSRYEEWCQRSVKTKNEQKRSNVTYSTLPICLSVCSLCNVNKESKQRYAHKINHCQYHYLFPYIANPRYCYPDKCEMPLLFLHEWISNQSCLGLVTFISRYNISSSSIFLSTFNPK